MGHCDDDDTEVPLYRAKPPEKRYYSANLEIAIRSRDGRGSGMGYGNLGGQGNSNHVGQFGHGSLLGSGFYTKQTEAFGMF